MISPPPLASILGRRECIKSCNCGVIKYNFGTNSREEEEEEPTVDFVELDILQNAVLLNIFPNICCARNLICPSHEMLTTS